MVGQQVNGWNYEIQMKDGEDQQRIIFTLIIKSHIRNTQSFFT